MNVRSKVAVLVSCHGTVERAEDIPEFVRNIRRGRAAPPEVVDEVTRRFVEIGGSPLMAITALQAKALEARLGVPVRAAGRLWGPYPEQVVEPLIAAGVRRLVSLPLAPQSVHIYNDFVRERLAAFDVEVSCAPSYGLEPRLVSAFADAIMEAFPKVSGADLPAVVLSAHSLPLRVLASGDTYQRDFEQMAAAVADALVSHGLERQSIHVAYQSQGMGGGEWLGPALPEVFAQLWERGHRGLLVAPIGFVAEHVETLYDIDVEAAGLARDRGFTAFVRMAAMNDRAGFIDALEVVARPLVEAAAAAERQMA